LCLRAFARVSVGIDQFAEVCEFGVGEAAGFDEVGGKAAGGSVEDAIDEFADHRFGGGGLGDGGRPLLPAGSLLAADEALIQHYFEHRGDGGRSDIALAAERFADGAE
jgi:hypothetical protein